MSTNQYASLTDRELIYLLLQEDMKAWNHVLLNMVAPLSRMSKYLQICRKHNISPDSLVTAVWIVPDVTQQLGLRCSGGEYERVPVELHKNLVVGTLVELSLLLQ